MRKERSVFPWIMGAIAVIAVIGSLLRPTEGFDDVTSASKVLLLLVCIGCAWAMVSGWKRYRKGNPVGALPLLLGMMGLALGAGALFSMF